MHISLFLSLSLYIYIYIHIYIYICCSTQQTLKGRQEFPDARRREFLKGRQEIPDEVQDALKGQQGFQTLQHTADP